VPFPGKKIKKKKQVPKIDSLSSRKLRRRETVRSRDCCDGIDDGRVPHWRIGGKFKKKKVAFFVWAV
jgi:hypothetical protein